MFLVTADFFLAGMLPFSQTANLNGQLIKSSRRLGLRLVLVVVGVGGMIFLMVGILEYILILGLGSL